MLEDLCDTTSVSNDDDSEITDEHDLEEIRAEKASEHQDVMDKLPEPLRTRSFRALEELSLRRGCTRLAVVEAVQRRMYQNIYKPAMEARKVHLQPGDICVWKVPQRRKPKGTHQVKGKAVRVTNRDQSLPSRCKVEYYLDGTREPPEFTKDNSKFFTLIEVPVLRLYFTRRAGDNVARDLDADHSMCESEEEISVTGLVKRDVVVTGVERFAVHLREFFKENGFSTREAPRNMPLSHDIEVLFALFDNGAADFILETVENERSYCQKFSTLLRSWRKPVMLRVS